VGNSGKSRRKMKLLIPKCEKKEEEIEKSRESGSE